MTYTIDLREAASRADIHARIRRGLPVPDYYGNNLDALHDVLTSFGRDTRIVFENADTVSCSMRSYIDALKWMCSEAAEENPDIAILWK